MRFLVDESAGARVSEYLRDQGYDVLAAAEVSPRASDEDIINWALADERIIITNDKDFGELVYRSGKHHAGILLFRLRNETSANKVGVLAGALAQYKDRLPGRFTVLTEDRIRIRWQPDDRGQAR